MGNQDENAGVPDTVSNLGALCAELERIEGVRVDTVVINIVANTWEVPEITVSGWCATEHSKMSNGHQCHHRLAYQKLPE